MITSKVEFTYKNNKFICVLNSEKDVTITINDFITIPNGRVVMQKMLNALSILDQSEYEESGW